MVQKSLSFLLVLSLIFALTLGVSAAETSETVHNSDLIAAGSYHTAWINQDGSVDAVGGTHSEYLYGPAWKDVVKISAYHQTVGIQKDGTVAIAGPGFYGKYKVNNWSDIIDVDINECNILGLTSQGTVVITGEQADTRYYDIETWRDITAIAQGTYTAYGVRSDGTVVASGGNDWGQKNISHWTDIVAVSAGTSYVAGLRSDGTVMLAGKSCWADLDVSGWTDIVSIRSGANHLVGLRSDGTVVATGYNKDKQCDISNWKNIVAIDAGFDHTIALTQDGTLTAVGSNRTSQCNFELDQRN